MVGGRTGRTQLDAIDRDTMALYAEHMFKAAWDAGRNDPLAVAKALGSGSNNPFRGALEAAIQRANAPMQQMMAQFSAWTEQNFGKSFTTTSPLSSGLVPYDLVAPTLMTYPVYTPLRNLIPRVPGQGLKHLFKILTSISGALPGGLATPGNRISIPELPAGGGIAGSNWPNQLPSSGTQTSIDLQLPYKFFGLTEAASWLAQFAGQGFDDAAGLASLVLLQEMMLLEERAIISGTSIALSAPAVPGLTARSAGTGETALSGVTQGDLWVSVTAVNFYGETVASTRTAAAWSAGQVIDVAIAPVPGAMAYNIYVGTSSTNPGNAGMWLMAAGVGGYRYTLMGAIPTGGTNPPTADTGTSSSNDYEGMLSVISGHAASGGSPVYPAGQQGGYINQSVGSTLTGDVVNTALVGMWNGSGAYLADPDDLWAEGTDLANFSQWVVDTSSGSPAYRIQINEGAGGVESGVAIATVRNPITQKAVNVRVHPYYTQGTATLNSWKIPHPQANVGNIWENVMVQDYLSISWPVIDVTFRYSTFMYGTLSCVAPVYNGLLQGIQRKSTTPYS